MNNPNNLSEWTIVVKRSGAVFVAHESVDGTAGAGQLNNDEADRFLKFVWGPYFKEHIEALKHE